MSSPAKPHRRGKAVRDGVLAAAVNELLNAGFDGVTIASVAESAGVHVTSVYRRWKTKEQLITDAVLTQLDPTNVAIPDTGDLRGDLLLLAGNLRDAVDSPQSRALLRIAALPLEVDRLEEARQRILDGRTRAALAVVERAIERGEVADDVDAAVALDALYAPILARMLIRRDQVDESYLVALVDLVFRGISRR
ncbi:TetR/AcrR family transcriptional regulator [Williamsia sp. CHRR-6]|uniref:TetR/AcrR family transcriptional regulator n=1 Tax=Williamsia sp. CHRR-6 TaxID=2835871 RepID=UPI001BDA48C9|nr:TetR/AcrR family transcriptional regulator [Williamsia sp. CHRR-6]MBT0566377.1 TetR/AcrR family transcriptional regulator [Williamsia sp. CHRR-6]